MNDHDKTKEQLINELESLRHRLGELELFEKEKKQDSEEIKKKVHFLQTIIDTIPSPIFFKDTKGRYSFCNSAFEEYAGLKKDEIIGKKDYDLNPERIADPYHKLDNILLRNGGVQDYEVSFQNPDGTSHAVLFNKACYISVDGSVGGLVGVITDVTERKIIEEEKKELIRELQKALAEIKTLGGLLPICSFCKKIRDDKGYWSRLEEYIQTHSQAEFSHGICPDCLKKHYPEYYNNKEGKTK